jgi:hypothetical protein
MGPIRTVEEKLLFNQSIHRLLGLEGRTADSRWVVPTQSPEFD